MPSLQQKLSAGETVVTAELTPPKGTDLSELFAKAQSLQGWVDAINVTESARALMSIAPIAAARLMLDRGIEAIVQMTARDRNRIAIQADLLGAAVLGVHNFVFMGGDPPKIGDHPEAKPVFDLTASQMAAAARELTRGRDMSGKPLRGTPQLFIGATVNPGATDFAGRGGQYPAQVRCGGQLRADPGGVRRGGPAEIPGCGQARWAWPCLPASFR